VPVETVDVEVLWELLHGRAGRYSAEDLADLALGTRSDAAVRAVEEALRADTVRFRVRKGLYEPRSTEAVETTLDQQRIAEERDAMREASVAATRLALSGGASLDWEEHAEFLKPLEELAIHGDNTPFATRETAEQLLRDLSRSKGGPWMAAVRALTALGRFEQDENLLLLRHRIPLTFDAEVEEAVKLLVEGANPVDDPAREDLTELLTIAIDDVDTDEVDDALSATPLEGGAWRIDVHIADASAWVPTGGLIDAEARRRGLTLYLPDRRVPMLPDELAYNRISLREDEVRAALTFRIDVDPLGRILGFEPLLSKIRVDCQLPYEEVESLLDARSDTPLGHALRALFRLGGILCKQRISAGALEVQPPEVKVKVDSVGTVRVTPVDRFSPARRLVSEWMIQCGRLAADWCSGRELPVVYRHQETPDDPPDLPQESVVDAVAFNSIIRKLRKATVSSKPAPHWGLGVEAYTQVTSPIRRYADLIMHRQIKASLKADPDAPPASEEEVFQAIGAADKAGERIAKIERETNRYFVYRYLESHRDEPIAALVVAPRDRGRWRISLDDLAVQGSVALQGSPSLRDIRMVEVVAVSARDDRLQLREVGQPSGAPESGG
jgi:exoribonuclease-2